MNQRWKPWLAVIIFGLSEGILMGLLAVADRLGVPHDVLAMAGFSGVMIGGGVTFAYVMWLAGFHG